IGNRDRNAAATFLCGYRGRGTDDRDGWRGAGAARYYGFAEARACETGFRGQCFARIPEAPDGNPGIVRNTARRREGRYAESRKISGDYPRAFTKACPAD